MSLPAYVRSFQCKTPRSWPHISALELPWSLPWQDRPHYSAEAEQRYRKLWVLLGDMPNLKHLRVAMFMPDCERDPNRRAEFRDLYLGPIQALRGLRMCEIAVPLSYCTHFGVGDGEAFFDAGGDGGDGGEYRLVWMLDANARSEPYPRWPIFCGDLLTRGKLSLATPSPDGYRVRGVRTRRVLRGLRETGAPDYIYIDVYVDVITLTLYIVIYLCKADTAARTGTMLGGYGGAVTRRGITADGAHNGAVARVGRRSMGLVAGSRCGPDLCCLRFDASHTALTRSPITLRRRVCGQSGSRPWTSGARRKQGQVVFPEAQNTWMTPLSPPGPAARV